jgi:hypothetical protein
MVLFMKPNFQEMSKAELKAYVLEHRDDLEAMRQLFSRRTPGTEHKRYPPLFQNGVAIEENIRVMQDVIQQRIRDNESSQN